METQSWNLDTTHSGIHFSVRHMVFAKVRGRFGVWAGQVDLDPRDLASSTVSVDIEGASIDTGVPERDQHLRSPDFLDVERFPRLRFESREIEPVGADRYRVHGALTIRGVTRPVVLDAEYRGLAADPWGNERIAFTATTSLDRGDFGLVWNQVLEAGGVLVGDRIDVEIEVQAVRGAASHAA